MKALILKLRFARWFDCSLCAAHGLSNLKFSIVNFQSSISLSPVPRLSGTPARCSTPTFPLSHFPTHALPAFSTLLTLLTLLTLPHVTQAFPPAPHHLLYGLVRDELGNPLSIESAEVILETMAGTRIQTSIRRGSEPGVNYRLAVPMDAGITSDLYKPTALRPLVPFKIRVRIGPTTYLPIEMAGDYSKLGQPAQSTRLNLTLGEDSDGDGLPDAWERALIAQSGGTKGLNDIRPGDDFDRDGLSNVNEYLAGTYAFDNQDGFALKILRTDHDLPRLEFMAIKGRTYTIFGSADMKEWQPVRFRLPAAGLEAADAEAYQATDARRLEVEVSSQPGLQALGFFKLMVQ